MRAKEFINEEINPDIRHPQFKHEVEMHGMRFTAIADQNSGFGNELIITAYDGNKEVGKAEFYEEPHDDALISRNTWVDDNYQGQNIATNMYAYAKMLGNDIMPSDMQTDAGERMWRSWNQSGQSKHILPKGQKGYREFDESMDEQVVYHVTPTRNVRSIMKQGLRPTIGDRTSQIAGEKSGIYVFPDKVSAEDAVMNWLGDEFDDEPLTMLQVNISGLDKYVQQGADYELIVGTSIDPSRIKVLSDQL